MVGGKETDHNIPQVPVVHLQYIPVQTLSTQTGVLWASGPRDSYNQVSRPQKHRSTPKNDLATTTETELIVQNDIRSQTVLCATVQKLKVTDPMGSRSEYGP